MQPSKGVTIIGFTPEQTRTFNLVNLTDDIKLEIQTSFNPNEFSIEEAVVVFTHPDQDAYKPGDNVLIDFSVFTAGKYPGHFMHSAETRYIEDQNGLALYWLYDQQHPVNSSEIFGTVNDKGEASPIGDCVLLYPQEKPKEVFELKNNLYLPTVNDEEPPFFATVYASPVNDIKKGDVIFCEGGLNPEIRFRGITIEYINLPYIIGWKNDAAPFGILLA